MSKIGRTARVHGGRSIAAVAAMIALMGVAQANSTLTVVNQCTKTVWMQQQNIDNAPSVVKLAPGKSHTYKIVKSGDPSTRVWPKLGCDSSGNDCTVGQSVPPCPAAGCTPAMDSLVEASFACITGGSNCPVDKATTYYDVSQVDGFTLPFKVEAQGSASNPACENVSCSGFNVKKGCPSNEDLSSDGKYPALASEDLHAYSPGTKQVIGCFSPCEKLTAATVYGGLGYAATDDQALLYCCPSFENDPEKTNAVREACLAGPVPNTQYVDYVHKTCGDNAYAWAYDDANGLKSCNGTTKIKMTICP